MAANPLVLIHGYPFDRTLWDQVTRYLEPGLRVLTPNLRGFGGRSPGPEKPSLERMAQDIAELLDQELIPQAVVAGMSMGGYVALAFAEQFHERLAGLGLVSSQPWPDTDEAKAARRSMIEKVRREGATAAAQGAIPKMFAEVNAGRAELQRFPALGAERAGVPGITWALEAMALRPDRTQVLKSLSVPVLIVHGTDDKFIPVARAREMVELCPEAEFVEIDQAGHATPLEAPEKVAHALQQLVKRANAYSR